MVVFFNEHYIKHRINFYINFKLNKKIILFIILFFNLNDKLVWDWSHELLTGFLSLNDVGFSWLGWNSLQDWLVFGFEVSLSSLFVLVDSVDETKSALGVLDVFNSEVDSLGNDVSSASFVYDDPDGVLGDVVYSTSFTVVDFVWHTLLDGTITFDVDDVASFVDVHVGGQAWHTLVSELLGEHVSGTPSFTMSVGHLRMLGGLLSFCKFDLRL